MRNQRNQILLLISLGCVACGKVPEGQDGRLQPYITKFDDQYHVFVEQDVASSMVAMYVGAPSVGYHWGECGKAMDGAKSANINLEIWFFLSDTSKQNLVYKYEAMCYWGRQETTSTFEDGCPNSLMNKVLINDDCFNGHKQDLLSELGR